jgi:TonB family protein
MNKHPQHTYTRRLLILLGISVLIHAVLLFNWSTTYPLLEFDYQLQNLTLNLEPIEVSGQKQQSQKKAANRQQSQSAKIATPMPDKPTKTVPTTPPGTTAQEASVANKTPDEQQTVSKATTSSMNRARILSQIRHDLSQYFYYPPHARRKGMQGTVLLSFGISGQGTVHDIRIVKSSGYAILDMAAQDAMQRLDRLKWYAALMHGKDMDLELPVIFRLTEG